VEKIELKGVVMSFTKQQLEKYADVLIYALETQRPNKKLKPYENVMIRYPAEELSLTTVIHRKLLKKKINVMLKSDPIAEIEKDYFSIADDRQIKFIPAGEKELFETLNGYISIKAPSSLTHLKNIDSKKISSKAIAFKKIKDILDKRESEGKFNWTLCSYPTGALSKAAGMSVKEYAGQIIKACFLNEKNPIKKWEEVFKNLGKIKKWLNSLAIDTMHVESKSLDFEVTVGEKRKFISGAGCNIPSFEIFTCPDYRHTRGTFFADIPLYQSGNLAKNIKLVFEKGKVIKASASLNVNFIKKMLNTDAGASRIGEFALVDKRFSKIDRFMANTLFDENYGGKHGSFHIAVGKSFDDSFAGDPKNLTLSLKKKLGFNTSAIHTDMFNKEDKTVKAKLKNGKKITIYEKGMFKI